MNYLSKFIFIIISIFVLGCEQKEYVKDFKVEGIAVGDSLLKYFSKEDILSLQRKEDIMGNPIDLTFRKYIDSDFRNYQFETYEGLQIFYEIDDDDFIIHGIGGAIWYDFDNKKCNDKYFEVKNILSEQFTTPRIEEVVDEKDIREGMGDTKTNSTTLYFENGSSIQIQCIDLDNELLEVADYFQVSIFSDEINNYWDN